MKTIEIRWETFARLARLARPLEDTPDDVIARLLDEAEGRQSGGAPLGRGDGGATSTPRHRLRSDGVSRRKMTPESAFYPWLIKVLAELGGRGEKAEVTRRIGLAFEARFTPVDLELVSSGEQRWENKVAWGRNRLKELGLIADNSPRGTWELTPKGWSVWKTKAWPDGWPDPEGQP